MLNELNMQGKKLCKLVDKIALIEENMIDSHNNLIRANQELDELAQSSGTKNRLFFWICTLLFVIFLIALLIFAFYYKKKQQESKNMHLGDSNTVLDNSTISFLSLRRNRSSSDIILPDESNTFYFNQSYNNLDNNENTSTDINKYENDLRNKAKLDTVHKIDPFSQNNNNITTDNTSRNDSTVESIRNSGRDNAINHLEETKLVNNNYNPSEVYREINSKFSDSDLNATKYHSNQDNHSKNTTESVDYLPGDYKDIAGSTNFLFSTSKDEKEVRELIFKVDEKAKE